MGLWTDIKATAVSWYNSPLLLNTVKQVGHYFYKTVQGLFQQASQAPDVVYAMIAHPPTRTVATHVGQIFVRDVLPIGMVSYAWCLAEPAGRDYFFDDESGYATQATGLLVMGSLITANYIFMMRNTIRHSIHSAVLTLESTKGLNERNQNVFDVCTRGPEVCTGKRYAQGAVRDTVTFYMTEALIGGVGIPIIANLLSIYHHGDYIIKMILPGMCERHQVEYLKEHSELALSLGLAHAVASASMTFVVQNYTGIPAVFYQKFFSQAALLWLVSAGAHMRLPAAVTKSERMIVDPVLFLQSAMGFATDTFLLGLKKQIPRMMTQPPSDIPWAAIMRYLAVQWSRPWADSVKQVVLPSMLQSQRQFLGDLIINVYFEERRKNVLYVLNTLEEIRGEFLLSLVAKAANSSQIARAVAAALVKQYFGTPPVLTKSLIQLIESEFCMQELQRFRHYLEALHPIETINAVKDDNDNHGGLRDDGPMLSRNESLAVKPPLSEEQKKEALKRPSSSSRHYDVATFFQPSFKPLQSADASKLLKRPKQTPQTSAQTLFKSSSDTSSSSSSSYEPSRAGDYDRLNQY